ncbi:MAG: type II toxin-antitoxin system VapB family antitoxin [Pseudomonadota bacterium]
MALFIRDDEVDALAAELQKATKTGTKKEAVRQALRNELERAQQRRLADTLVDLQDRVAAMGPDDPGFDMKKFTDEMWGNI